MSYAFPPGGLPDQSVDPEGTAIFTEAYAVLPAVTQRDIVTSFLPGWQNTRVWVLARPLSGFAETFAQYAVELGPEGGSATPEPDKDAQAVIFVARGSARLTLGQETFDLRPGSYAYIPPSAVWDAPERLGRALLLSLDPEAVPARRRHHRARSHGDP